VEDVAPRGVCDAVLSLERVPRCDVYRAGDGVHAAWLRRRRVMEPGWRNALHRFNPKHRQLLALERELFGDDELKAVITNSRFVAGEIEEHFAVGSQKLVTIRNGLPEDQFRVDPEVRRRKRAELQLAPDCLAVVFVGSGWQRKGLPWAIGGVARTAERLGQVKLLVAGRGKPARYQQGGDAGIVQFLGPRSDIPDLLQAADIFLLPTVYDPFSNATLEALAAGLPVVTTRGNGVSEIMDPGRDGTVLEDPRDEEGIASALVAWGETPRESADFMAVRRSISNAAAQWTIQRNVTETVRLLENL
jgi:UDP-glucose:(heptosyl)LPS alpha-1,3-glucosyltransferase